MLWPTKITRSTRVQFSARAAAPSASQSAQVTPINACGEDAPWPRSNGRDTSTPRAQLRLQGAHGVCVAGEAVQQQNAEAGGVTEFDGSAQEISNSRQLETA